MTTGKVTTPQGEVIEIDMGSMEERIEGKMKGYFNELKEYYEKKDKDKDGRGKGVIESRVGPNSTKLIEQLRKSEHNEITEQWTVVIPRYTEYEVAAHLRDYVFVSDVVKGSVGEDVNIPYVKDFDFGIKSARDDTIPEKTGIINAEKTALIMAGAYTDVWYADIEKINQNLLDEVNRVFAHAAVRAEDKSLIDLVNACTTKNFAGVVGTGGSAFALVHIPQAIGKLIAAGKEVHPGDCVLYLTAHSYGKLLELLAASSVIGFARGDIITKGVVEDYLGVRVLVGGELTYEDYKDGTATYETNYLFRAKRALALAPKRDILIETDRLIMERQLRVAGSHTYGVLLLDANECVRIWTDFAYPA